jgi:hypothetical protein
MLTGKWPASLALLLHYGSPSHVNDSVRCPRPAKSRKSETSIHIAALLQIGGGVLSRESPPDPEPSPEFRSLAPITWSSAKSYQPFSKAESARERRPVGLCPNSRRNSLLN